jgi:nuclear transport factor 2 (NTF2) superfamily protein
MRERLIAPVPPSVSLAAWEWLDVAKVALVEVTSEDKTHTIESALVEGETRAWRAAEPGLQTIRLLFDKPQRIKRIQLAFEETETKRTQEFTLRWSQDGGQSYREIVRQQWNFSPPGTVREIEDYVVTLPDVTVLELNIMPDQSGGEARSSLLHLRLG